MRQVAQIRLNELLQICWEVFHHDIDYHSFGSSIIRLVGTFVRPDHIVDYWHVLCASWLFLKLFHKFDLAKQLQTVVLVVSEVDESLDGNLTHGLRVQRFGHRAK